MITHTQALHGNCNQLPWTVKSETLVSTRGQAVHGLSLMC